MRTINKVLLVLNGGMLLFIGLWLLVGGSNRGYYGGGATSEVDGILLLFLALFNLAYLVAAFFILSRPSRQQAQALASEALGQQVSPNVDVVQSLLRTWSLWALIINGVLVLFVGLWLLISTGRREYFQANATQVDMILLLFVSVLNLAYMALLYLRFTLAVRNVPRQPTVPA